MPKFLLETLPRLEQSVHGFLKEPVVLGELLGRTGDRGHLSKLSLFVGGSGYIMNKPLLQALHARVLPLHNGTALKQKLGRFGKSILPALHATMDTLIHDDLSARESVVGSNDHWRLLSVFIEGVEAVSSAEEESPTCDPMKQLSCHRYIYSGNANGWSAQRLMPQANLKHGYYKVFTSTRNGTIYDTQMP
eukprot:gene4955-3546_t